MKQSIFKHKLVVLAVGIKCEIIQTEANEIMSMLNQGIQLSILPFIILWLLNILVQTDILFF